MAADSIPSKGNPTTFIKTLRPTSIRREIPDGGQSGLYLLQQPTGALSWAIRVTIVRTGEKPKAIKQTIGRYHEDGSTDDIAKLIDSKQSLLSSTRALSVAQARTIAKRIRDDGARGIDHRDMQVERAKTLNDWFDDFIATARTKGFKGRPVKASTADEYRRIIDISILPSWKHIKEIRNIDYHEIEKLLGKLSVGARRNAYAVLSAFFRWKPVVRHIGYNVIELAEAPAKPVSRDRVLSFDGDANEIKRIWKAADKCGYPFGPMVQLLLLTGQRRDEIAELRWSELSADGTTITLEGVRTKNSTAHIVPLAPLAQSIIKALPRIADATGKPSEYVFTTTATTPFSGFSNGKRALDKHIGEAALPDWHLHDLRRTASTILAKLGVKQEVTEAILNHKTGKVSGVAAIYNRYDYEDEKRDALEQLATRIQAITANNVTILKRPA